MFQKWLQESEALVIKKFCDVRKAVPPLELATTDVNVKYQAFLDALFDMVQELKVPGRKAKAYEQ